MLSGNPMRMRSHFGKRQPKEPKLMLRNRLLLLPLIIASIAVAAWSGIGMADDITPENVGTMATNAKTAGLSGAGELL